jgi:indolepyruvate ferredoxin oxidoreductase beta subunit
MGEADILLSFEQIETLRYFPFLSEKGQIVVNDQKILPPSVFTGQQEYPNDVLERIMTKAPNTIVVNGQSVAEKIGNLRVLNVIFLGVLSKFLDIPAETYENTLKESLKPKLVDINLQAFNEGRAMVTA